MGRQHFIISSGINVDANYDNFNKLIKLISDKGLIFYEFVSLFEKISDPKSFFLSNEYIINKLTNLNGENDCSFESKYQDTVISFLISAPSNDKGFSICWDTNSSSWDKNFPKEPCDDIDTFEMRDNARYARLQLQLVKDFPLEYFFIAEQDFHIYFEETPSDSLKAKFMTELANDDLAHKLTYNILYNKCTMLDSYENQMPYNIDEFEKLLEYLLNYRKEFKFVIQCEDQFLEVIIDDASKITITPINYIKKVTFEGKEFTDIPFYVRLMLGFCEDLAILELRTNFE